MLHYFTLTSTIPQYPRRCCLHSKGINTRSVSAQLLLSPIPLTSLSHLFPIYFLPLRSKHQPTMSNNASSDSAGNTNGQSTGIARVSPDGPMIVSSDMLSSAARGKETCNEASSNTSSNTDAQNTPTGSSCESIHGSSSPSANSSSRDKNHHEDTRKDESQKKVRADRTNETPSARNAQGLFFPNACVFVGK